MPELGPCQDVQRLFGIKRGTLYNLAAGGLVKSVSLRQRGNVKGVRLFYLQSVSDYLHKLMEERRTGELNATDPGVGFGGRFTAQEITQLLVDLAVNGVEMSERKQL